VHPRYRTPWLLPFLLTLLFLILPARASADFSAFGVPRACPGVPAGGLTSATDTTSVPSGWQPADIVVSLAGTNVAGWEWMVDCGTPQSGGPGQTVTFNVSGAHVISHRAQDSNGVWTDWTDDVVQLDKIIPSNTTPPQSGWSKVPVDVTVQGSDSTSAINHVEWNLDSGGVQSGPSGTSVHVTGDGIHTLDTQVEDLAGNRSSLRNDTVQIDSVNPIDQTVAPSIWQYTPTTITVTGSDALSGVGHVEWLLDGAPGSGANGTGVVIPDGTHSLKTRIVDLAGNTTAYVDHIVQVDTTGPQDTTSVPGPWQPTSPVDIHVTGVDPQGSGINHVEWKLDGGSIQTGPNNSTVSISGDGVHTIETSVVDGGGEQSGWNTRYVRIDTVTPTDQTVTSNGWFRTAQTVPVTGLDAHSGVQKVEWKLDSGATQSATGNPANVLISGDGNHTLVTRIYDNAGHVSGYKTNYVQIDGSAPNNTTPAADSSWRKTQYSVVLSGTDSVSGMSKMLYSVDGGAIQEGPSGILTAIVSGSGVHTLRTYAEDIAGNQSGYRDETIRIDNVPPTDTTTAPGTPVQNNYPVTLGGTDAHSGINIIKYTVDGGPEQSGAPGATVKISGNGPHVLQTMAIDNAGNDSGWKSQTVTVDVSLTPDSTPPTDTTTVSAGWKTSNYNVTLSATDGSGVGVDYMQYRIDGGSIQTAAAGATVTVSGDGSHDLETRAFDLLGNSSTWKFQTVNIDTTVPVDTSVITVAPAWTTSRDFVLSGTDATSGVASISQTGAHTLSTRIQDNAGNWSVWRDDSVGIDKLIPTLTVACGSVEWRSTPATCSVTADGGISGLAALTGARGDSAPSAVSGSSYVVDADGAWSLSFRAVDGAGNEKLALAQVKVDRTAPAAAVSCAAGAGTSWVCTANGSDALSGVAGLTWSVNGSAGIAVTNGGTFAVQKGVVTVSATDRAGNAGTSSPVTLADRSAPVTPTKPTKSGITARERSEAVLRLGKGTTGQRALGQLEISALPATTSVTLRPLALGPGSYKVVLKLTADRKSKTVTKTVKSKAGYSPQVTIKLGGAAEVDVKLTVSHKSGSRWKTYATGHVKL